MQIVQNGYRGLSVLIDLNWDRFLYLGTLFAALGASAWLAARMAGL